MVGIIKCPNCGTRVLPSRDGTCPSCHSLVTEAELPSFGSAQTTESTGAVTPPIGPASTLPPISSFWRRLAAWVVDSLLLGLVGQVIGWPLSSFWFQIGPYGRIAGLLIIVLYFGVLNSRVGDGQTLGKRLLKIAVRDKDNRPISIKRSFLRISILAVPAILNQWGLPIFQSTLAEWILTVIIFGVGGAILYTMIFNRRTRQGLHDLICRTYVVHLPGKPVETYPQTPKVHWVISGILVGFFAILPGLAILYSSVGINNAEPRPLVDPSATLQNDSRFFSGGYGVTVVYSNQHSTVHILTAQFWYKGQPSNAERDRAITDIARVVLAKAYNIEQYDLLKIGIISQFDLGISTGNLTFGDSEPIQFWRQKVSGSTTG